MRFRLSSSVGTSPIAGSSSESPPSDCEHPVSRSASTAAEAVRTGRGERGENMVAPMRGRLGCAKRQLRPAITGGAAVSACGVRRMCLAGVGRGDLVEERRAEVVPGADADVAAAALAVPVGVDVPDVRVLVGEGLRVVVRGVTGAALRALEVVVREVRVVAVEVEDRVPLVGVAEQAQLPGGEPAVLGGGRGRTGADADGAEDQAGRPRGSGGNYEASSAISFRIIADFPGRDFGRRAGFRTVEEWITPWPTFTTVPEYRGMIFLFT